MSQLVTPFRSTWIWEEQFSKYVEEMVKLRPGAEIRALCDALGAAATNQVRSKDEQTALLCGELASINTS
jgi:hypothetical protein